MIWVARYRDGTSLRQFNPDNSENSFNSINQDKLIEFSIIDDDTVYSVSLENGLFNVNGLKIGFDEISKDSKLRLIYFRRVRQTMGSEVNHSIFITYNLGYQTTKDNRNIKRYLMINEDGIKFNCGGK